MSHTVKVNIIADQFIRILGKEIRIRDLISIVLDPDGVIIDFTTNSREKDQIAFPPNNRTAR